LGIDIPDVEWECISLDQSGYSNLGIAIPNLRIFMPDVGRFWWVQLPVLSTVECDILKPVNVTFCGADVTSYKSKCHFSHNRIVTLSTVECDISAECHIACATF
jgi:hypothetical protein